MRSNYNTNLMSKIGKGIALVAIGALTLSACKDKIVEVDIPPHAPQGVTTIRGDEMVTIYWYPVEVDDLDHYRVYRGLDSANGAVFNYIGSTTNEEYVDNTVNNGVRYYYAITAVDNNGNESEQSADWGGATPRPDGSNRTAFYSNDDPNGSGFDLSAGDPVAFNSVSADIWFDYDSFGNVYINADSIGPILGDIQDMGYTVDLDEIRRAPQDGWSFIGYYEVIEGHTYVIWTQDDQYAKVRVTSVLGDRVIFDYAYQEGISADGSGGEPELAPTKNSNTSGGKKFNSAAYRTDFSQSPKSSLSGAVNK